MIEWMIIALAISGIGGIAGAFDKRKSQMELVQHKQFISTFTAPSKSSARYQNSGKQMMYEVYLKDLKENPQWAAFKVKHNQYGGYVFDNTEK